MDPASDKLSRVHEWREDLLSHAEALSSTSKPKGIDGLFTALTKRNDSDESLRIIRDLISAIILSNKSSSERTNLLKKCYDLTKEIYRYIPDSNPFASLLWEPLESIGVPALAYEIRRLSIKSQHARSREAHDGLITYLEGENHPRNPDPPPEARDSLSGLHVLHFLVANWEGSLISLPGFGSGDLIKATRRACLCLRDLDSGNATFQQVRPLLSSSLNRRIRTSLDTPYTIGVLPNILENRCTSHSRREAILASDCLGFTAFISIPHIHAALAHLTPQPIRSYQSHSPSTSSPSSPFSASPVAVDFVSIDLLAAQCAWTLEIGRNSLRLLLVDYNGGSSNYDGLVVDATVEILQLKDKIIKNHHHKHNFLFSLPKSKLLFPIHPRNGNSSASLFPCFLNDSSPTPAPRNVQEAVVDLQVPCDVNGFDDKRLYSSSSGELKLKLVVKFDKPLAYPMDGHTSLLIEPSTNDPQPSPQRSPESRLEVSDSELNVQAASLPVVNVIGPEIRQNNGSAAIMMHPESSDTPSNSRLKSLPKPPNTIGYPNNDARNNELEHQSLLSPHGAHGEQPTAMWRPLPKPPPLKIVTVNLTPSPSFSQPLDTSGIIVGDSPRTATTSNGSTKGKPSHSESYLSTPIGRSHDDLHTRCIPLSSPYSREPCRDILPNQSARYRTLPYPLTPVSNDEKRSRIALSKQENGSKGWRREMMAEIEELFSTCLPTDRYSEWSDDMVIYPIATHYLAQYLCWRSYACNAISGANLTARSFLSKVHGLSTAGNFMEVIGRQGQIREYLIATHRRSGPSPDEKMDRVWSNVLHQAFQFDEQDLALTLSFNLNTPNNHALDEAVAMLEQDLINLMSILQSLIDRKLGSHRILERFLHKLVERTGILPDYLYLSDIKRTGDNPVAGGGFADVWKGQSSKYIVALKVIRIFGLANPNDHQHQEFCKEAMIWRQFSHQNILPFYGVCISEFSPRLALVSPWMENGDIITYIKKNHNVNRIGLISGIGLGLLYLHDLKPTVVHGDLRAANVLVDDYGRPKLADFGLSKIVDSQASTVAASSFNGKGAMRWQAPELLDSSRFGSVSCGVSTYSDVYAFASVCLEVFTKEVPFSLLRDGQVFLEVVMYDRRPPRPAADSAAVQNGLTDEIWALMERCWSTQPVDRPDMREVVKALTESCP